MYSSIRIRGYRCLDDFRMDGLGQVNLLVGANNCGKTSMLECVQLLATPNPSVLPTIATRRGEWQASTDSEHRLEYAVDISHLFAGRDIARRVVVAGERAVQPGGNSISEEVQLGVDECRDKHPSRADQAQLFVDDNSHESAEGSCLRVHWTAASGTFDLPLGVDGMLPVRTFQVRRLGDINHGTQFIRSSGMTARGVAQLLDDVVLTEHETLVTHALNILEPRVERVAAVAHERHYFLADGPGGIFVKLRGVQERVPIGSTGDGMWRMLGLALMLAKAKGGVLLVDEIDTGLHYSVMESMWRMVCEQAAALSVQVFATTHSRDCYESLASFVEADETQPETVTIQRIERHRNEAVRIGGRAIVVAAERGLEVR